MKVSIITVCYNSEKTIQDTIESVLAQTYPEIEYIIVDGKSVDSTLSIIDKYRDKLGKVISEKDNGIYDAMNKGIKAASGDVIGILNSDDFYVGKGVISEVVDTFNKYEADCVYSDLAYVKEDDKNSILRSWTSGNYHQKMFLKGWMPPHPTFFLKRNHYLKFGLYNTDFKISADYELMLRMLYKYGLKPGYLKKRTINMRAGGASNVSIKSRIKANQEDRLAWKINDLKPQALTLFRKPLSKIFQYLNK